MIFDGARWRDGNGKLTAEEQMLDADLRRIGMCPWCGESLHPGRKCHNDDAIVAADSGSRHG